MPPQKISILTQLLVTASLLMIGGNVHAADGVELSPTQLKNNEEGVRLLSEGKFESAKEHFELSLRIGEANITYLNLGRTYQKMGECLLAREFLEKAATAPAISSPTPAEVESVRRSFLSELPEVCPARVKVSCSPSNLVVRLDEAQGVECGALVDVSPGPHLLTGQLGSGTTETRFEAAEGQHLSVEVALSAPSASALPMQVEERSTTRATIGWVSLGVGAAFLTTAVVFDGVLMQSELDAVNAAVSQASEDREAARANYLEAKNNFEGLQTPTLIFYGVGGAALITGTALLLWPDSESQVGIAPTESGASVGWSGRF